MRLPDRQNARSPLILFDAVHFKMSGAKKDRERRERARLYKLGLKPYDLTRLTAFHEAGHVVQAIPAA